MSTVTLNKSIVIATGCLIFVLTLCDVALGVHSLRQRALLENLTGAWSVGAPKDGQIVPTLVGSKMSTGQRWSVVRQSLCF
jgi:hypothetical protein